jgi:hypothetical protein
MQAIVVKPGDATTIDVYSSQPFVFRLKGGTDPLESIVSTSGTAFFRDQFKSFKVSA